MASAGDELLLPGSFYDGRCVFLSSIYGSRGKQSVPETLVKENLQPLLSYFYN